MKWVFGMASVYRTKFVYRTKSVFVWSNLLRYQVGLRLLDLYRLGLQDLVDPFVYSFVYPWRYLVD